MKIEKRSKIRVSLLAFTILFLLILSFYGIQTALSYSASKSSDINLLKKNNISTKDFNSLEVYDYVDQSTDSKFKVQIIEFDSEKKLDSWIKNKVEKNSGTKTINGNIVFIDQYKNYIFWRSGNTKFIQIMSIRHDTLTKQSLIDNFKTEGQGIFPDNLIEEYVSQYPSQCSNDGCMSQEEILNEKIKKDLKWFENTPSDVKDSNYYSGDDSCPIDETGWARLENSPSLSKDEIQEKRDHCKKYGEYKAVDGSPMPQSLKICGNEIDSYLNINGIYTYDAEVTMDECLLRERFLEDNEEYNPGDLSLLFEKRNELVLEELQFLESLKEELRSKVSQEKINKFIEEKIAKKGAPSSETKKLDNKNKGDVGTLNKRPEYAHYWFER